MKFWSWAPVFPWICCKRTDILLGPRWLPEVYINDGLNLTAQKCLEQFGFCTKLVFWVYSDEAFWVKESSDKWFLLVEYGQSYDESVGVLCWSFWYGSDFWANNYIIFSFYSSVPGLFYFLLSLVSALKLEGKYHVVSSHTCTWLLKFPSSETNKQ